MKKTTVSRDDRVKAMARKEADIWSALIGAHGSPNIQKYIVMPRIYSFARAIVNMDNLNPDREMTMVHNYAKNGIGTKIKLFSDFIDGVMSVEQAKEHLTSILQNADIAA